ncbi:hypothetical protein, partial [Noviherbaspirillum sp.]|uniref:hypothetical protein n=1 Tax=Noviherbaspirillum sp. TaxID=1926288 RepID=UPI003FA5314F
MDPLVDDVPVPLAPFVAPVELPVTLVLPAPVALGAVPAAEVAVPGVPSPVMPVTGSLPTPVAESSVAVRMSSYD